MRVLVDASAAFDQPAGIGRYARNVLTSAAGTDPDIRWTLARFPERRGAAPFPFDRDPAWPGDVSRRRTAPLTRRRADQLLFRFRAPADFRWLTGPGDVAYSPDFTIPRTGRVPAVVTIHDLAFLTHPDSAPAGLRAYLTKVVPAMVARCARVAVVSEATRHDVIAHLKVDPDRVVVVGNGVEPRFAHPTPLTVEQRAALGLPAEYLLMVGTLEPRKNHRNAFRALDHLPTGNRLPLVVAGRTGWDAGPILREAAQRGQHGQVIRLDYVPDAILPALYASASVALYPSWTEGFGLPVLEAMAAGVPVVTGVAPALREVGGADVWYADPNDPAAIAAAISAALHPDGRIERAQARAMEYTWTRSGKALVTLLGSIA